MRRQSVPKGFQRNPQCNLPRKKHRFMRGFPFLSLPLCFGKPCVLFFANGKGRERELFASQYPLSHAALLASTSLYLASIMHSARSRFKVTTHDSNLVKSRPISETSGRLQHESLPRQEKDRGLSIFKPEKCPFSPHSPSQPSSSVRPG